MDRLWWLNSLIHQRPKACNARVPYHSGKLQHLRGEYELGNNPDWNGLPFQLPWAESFRNWIRKSSPPLFLLSLADQKQPK
jgi:hypothetical protein